MSRSLEIPDPIFDALEQAASATGTTPVGWIAAHLPSNAKTSAGNEAKSLADLLEGHIGTINSGGNEALSQNTGDRFTEYVVQKRREGRL
jgi:hypothetical protein